MTRTRSVLGVIAGALLILSSGAHSLLGWEALRAQLAATNAPADLVQGLKMGWLFGGVAMLAFGIMVLAIFVKRLRGDAVSALPGAVIAVAYLAFGAWALVASNFDPFFFVFIVPGVLLALAASGRIRG